MDDLSQEIYALMGVSPLVYDDQADVDPKSVLVYVKKPGEEIASEEADPEAALESKTDQAKTEIKPKTRGRKPKVKAEAESETIVEEEAVAESKAVEAATEPEAEPKNGRRRRRRRSSAAKEAKV